MYKFDVEGLVHLFSFSKAPKWVKGETVKLYWSSLSRYATDKPDADSELSVLRGHAVSTTGSSFVSILIQDAPNVPHPSALSLCQTQNDAAVLFNNSNLPPKGHCWLRQSALYRQYALTRLQRAPVQRPVYPAAFTPQLFSRVAKCLPLTQHTTFNTACHMTPHFSCQAGTKLPVFTVHACSHMSLLHDTSMSKSRFCITLTVPWSACTKHQMEQLSDGGAGFSPVPLAFLIMLS